MAMAGWSQGQRDDCAQTHTLQMESSFAHFFLVGGARQAIQHARSSSCPVGAGFQQGSFLLAELDGDLFSRHVGPSEGYHVFVAVDERGEDRLCPTRFVVDTTEEKEAW